MVFSEDVTTHLAGRDDFEALGAAAAANVAVGTLKMVSDAFPAFPLSTLRTADFFLQVDENFVLLHASVPLTLSGV